MHCGFICQYKYCVTHIFPWGESQLGKTFPGLNFSWNNIVIKDTGTESKANWIKTVSD